MAISCARSFTGATCTAQRIRKYDHRRECNR
ncbi:hypothetical protein FOQG_19565 [Fusarium oxysporum f. sp. raphani 54005]|uniref:Uncharacterized protein n=1 Tax=Fusarium oxysporum f. sp. raphani 54005 TaxID=1089458 RepID=X0BA47_FUSOX|nr:hypothetical protein FOQG_19565 [Fusarium oxysporum f. sp. raphani 54005]